MSTIKETILSKTKYFNNNIIENIADLIPYYEHHFILFCNLNSLIYENLNCLLLGLNQSSIFTTNHLFERMVKVSLMAFHTKGYFIGNPDFEIKLEEAKKLYDGKILNETINLAIENGIITDDEQKILLNLKNKFRNPYSHAEAAKIIKDAPPTIRGFMFNFDDAKEAMNNGKSIPFKQESVSSFVFAQTIQHEFSKVKAFDYFKQIFDIMVEIDNRYQKQL